MSQGPVGVHFVGSIPLPTTSAAFDKLSSTLPSHITRLPDGEPAHRGNFAAFQLKTFPPRLVNPRFTNLPPPTNPHLTAEDISALQKLETGYDTAAIESYNVFSHLKSQGTIPPAVKFQVCLPTHTNVIASILPPFQLAVEPYYVNALQRALANIQAAIPHDQLAIQIDLAIDFALIEGASRNAGNVHGLAGAGDMWVPWFSPVEEGVVERVLGMVDGGKVQDDVELGFHFCYGDLRHKHFLEPPDTEKIAPVMRAILEGSGRMVQWVHFPVPKERCLDMRDAEVYLGPLVTEGCLRLLKAQRTEVYFGCVREGDEEGTRRRVEVIGKWLERQEEGNGIRWGVATECGSGRTSPDLMDEILSMLGQVSKPVR